MSDEVPKPTLEQSLERLRNLDEFRVVCDYIKDEREAAISRLFDAPTGEEAMKLAGIVSGYSNLHLLLLGT